jgi:hypothetical protein
MCFSGHIAGGLAPGALPDCERSKVDTFEAAPVPFRFEEPFVSSNFRVTTPLFLCLVTSVNLGHAQECTSDAQCPTNYECEFPPLTGETPTSSTGGSAVDESAPAPEPPAATDSNAAPSERETPANATQVGRCEPLPITCANDGECPAPARCGADGECELALTFCEDAAATACDPHYSCVQLGAQTCTSGAGDSSPGTGAPAAVDPDAVNGDPGAGSTGSPSANEGSAPANPTPPDAGNQPTADEAETDAEQRPACEPQTISACFPTPAACTSVQDCPSGWICEDISDNGFPDAFEGLERTCLPPGYVALLDDRLGLDPASEEVLGGTSESDSETGQITPDEGPGEVEDVLGADGDLAGANLGTQGGSEGTAPNTLDSGCHLAAGANRGGRSWLAVFLALGVALRAGRLRR